MIFKSTSSVRSIVRGLTEDRRASLSSVRFLPTQFQERIEGNDIRVHVVGNKALGVRVRGGAIDYRYAALEGARSEFEAIPLTLDLRRRCLRLSRACGLAFSGIDLRMNEAGAYCFEINPAPAFSFFEKASGQPIARELALWLAGERRSPINS